MANMASTTTDAADIISRLSWRPDYLDQTMIYVNPRRKPPPVKHIDRPSSLGILDRLPLEIQHSILNMLDLKTISNLSRVSVHGLAVVQSLPAYRELFEHAPYLAHVLGRTKLLGLHSLIQLRSTLRSDRCQCCPHYGAFLFVPTCVRCCWECLHIKPSLRAIPLKHAKRYFGLKEQHIQQLPIMHTIPGRYIFSHVEDLHSSHRLVSALAAKEQGIIVYKSAEKLENNLLKRLRARGSIITGMFLQMASATPLRVDSLARPGEAEIPAYDFVGVASIPFPWLQAPGIVENGLWCKGCDHVYELYDDDKLDSVSLSRLVPARWDPDRVLSGMVRRAWSKTGFLEHVRHCLGAKKLTQVSARDESS